MEPRLGYINLTKSKREGKVKAFFSLLIPTETVGTIELSGFKIVEGSKGLFISLPNRAVKSGGIQTVNATSGTISGGESKTKYYNNIRFESQEKYNTFRKELSENVLPLIERQLAAV